MFCNDAIIFVFRSSIKSIFSFNAEKSFLTFIIKKVDNILVQKKRSNFLIENALTTIKK